jgi:hypothetical protein
MLCLNGSTIQILNQVMNGLRAVQTKWGPKMTEYFNSGPVMEWQKTGSKYLHSLVS